MLSLLAVFACCILFAVLCKKPLRQYSWLFYLLAGALSVLLLLSFWVSFPRVFQMIVLYPLQRCYIAFSFFVIVMFMGVFREDSRIRTYFMPIRAELSILACIFTLPHIVRNIATFLPRLFSETIGVSVPVVLSILLALLLSALLLLLGITSFKVVKERMRTATWKRIQSLAYVFFIVIFLHLGLMLIPSALNGGIDAIQNLIIYSILFVLYIVLKIRRVFIDKAHTNERSKMREAPVDAQRVG